MAYETQSYETILARMIGRVSEKYPNLDTREGSIIFNALAPAALEMAIMYTELDNVLNESFVDTATREYLFLACKQMGMDTSVFDATAGAHKGEFNVEVSVGSRWNCDLYNYTVEEYLGVENEYYTYKLVCETLGTAPNTIVGDLTAISEIPSGLNYAKLVDCLIEGENEMSDSEIVDAYYKHVNSSTGDGNLAQYERWCNEYAGIGNYKIFPLWDGANTVKVSILSPSNQSASEELIDEFQDYIDPGATGMGDGVAPIGAFVTVTTATERPISVSANVTMVSGYTDTSVIDTALSSYFSSLAYTKTTVPYMNVGAVILSVSTVDSITDLKINGGTSDIAVGDEEIPVLGTTDWTVI